MENLLEFAANGGHEKIDEENINDIPERLEGFAKWLKMIKVVFG